MSYFEHKQVASDGGTEHVAANMVVIAGGRRAV
jgi:hypothetical protein